MGPGNAKFCGSVIVWLKKIMNSLMKICRYSNNSSEVWQVNFEGALKSECGASVYLNRDVDLVAHPLMENLYMNAFIRTSLLM